jgi:hypothetical protein
LTTAACTGLCAADHYCLERSTTALAWSCPVYSTSPIGSGCIDDCTCATGYEMNDEYLCVLIVDSSNSDVSESTDAGTEAGSTITHGGSTINVNTTGVTSSASSLTTGTTAVVAMIGSVVSALMATAVAAVVC